MVVNQNIYKKGNVGNKVLSKIINRSCYKMMIIKILTIISAPDILEKAMVNGSSFVHNFTGIEVSAEYEINLTCIFADREFDCGYSTIFSSELHLKDTVTI